MKMRFAFAIFLLTITTIASAQSKVFKEVSSEISSQMKTITQDDALIGYLVFTQLEKANKDSFNYQVSIMDENLNDIGKVEFREKNLQLHEVSFDQDLLCMVYLKSDIADLKSVSVKDIKNSVTDGKHALLTQLIDLEGKIVYSRSMKVDLAMTGDAKYLKKYASSTSMVGHLKHPVMLKNIPGKGFALFYGDANKNQITAFDIAGKELWAKTVPEAESYGMLTTSSDVYIMSKKKHQLENAGFEIRGYEATTGTAYDTYQLKDKNGNPLQVLSFEIDPVKGKPVVTGIILDKSRGNNYHTVKGLKQGPYEGLFTVALNGPKRSDIKERFSYWSDGSKAPEITKTGSFSEGKRYPRWAGTVRDFKGNTYFVGSTFIKKPRWGTIAAIVVCSPLVAPSFFLLAAVGTQKVKMTEEVVLMRQDSAGRLRNDKSIEVSKSRFMPGRSWVTNGVRTYTVTNTASKSNFLIVDEFESSIIYNIDKGKVVRKVPRSAGGVTTFIYPAKEGHIMVMEYNSSARETKLSIEALR